MSDANRTIASWYLDCPWCRFSLQVFDRGGPNGAGGMREHVETHGKTWQEFLARELYAPRRPYEDQTVAWDGTRKPRDERYGPVRERGET